VINLLGDTPRIAEALHVFQNSLPIHSLPPFPFGRADFARDDFQNR
jgi:hypothetical protein